MSPFLEIIDRYKNICSYCDAFWIRVFKKFSTRFACSPGCSTCCELQSVNFLEAYVIAGYVSDHLRQSVCPPSDGRCPFLADDRCRTYRVRPLICRTHGLLLRSKDFTDRIAVSCPFNFTDIDHATIDDAYVLDVDTVTTGLAKLNAAFCMLIGDVKKAKERIALSDLASGKIGRAWFNNPKK
ncbi:MAG: YkgJ family cysteine cluster protein [Chitinispirillaceae bacterium]|jgi:Fe-S-cluster containining protein